MGNIYIRKEKRQRQPARRMSIDKFHCFNQISNMKVVFEEDEINNLIQRKMKFTESEKKKCF